MSRRSTQPLSLIEIFRSVLLYRWRAFFTFLFLLAIGVAAVVLFPKKYESEAKIFVRLGRGSVTMDTTATTGQTISIQESRETEINSIVDMLESRRLTEAVAREVGPERILKKYALVEQWIEKAQDALPEISTSDAPDQEGLDPDELEFQEQLELAIKYLDKNVRVTSPKKSTTISITCRARTALLAQDIAKSLLAQYQLMHLQAYQADGSKEFFKENYELHDDLVKSFEDKMRTAKTKWP